ncbi:unnamed protein product [Caenorhabditis sp. 36 PRJEB53466]|nr:unnamed protein product [Caenorhabditis sp. 36 PRJEB53466]
MADWVDAFDEQCRSEGLEVPEKVEEEQSNATMEQKEEKKLMKYGGRFGSSAILLPPPPPPQTSFGAVSGIRAGGSFGSQCSPDGRGTPLGSTEDTLGGNIISVGIRRDKPACTFTRGGGFGFNRSMKPSTPTSFKTNHEGGRFGTLAPKDFGGTITSSAHDGSEEERTVGGRFGASASMGDTIGSLKTTSSTTSSLGGPFDRLNASKSSSTDMESTPLSSGDSSVGINRTASTVGGSFGSAKSTIGSAVGAFGEGSSDQKTVTSSSFLVNSPLSGDSVPSVGGSFGSGRVGGAFGARSTCQEPITSPNAQAELKTQQTESPRFGGAFGASRAVTSPPSVGRACEPISTVPAISLFTPETKSSEVSIGGSFGSSRSESPSVGGAFGSEPITSATLQSSRMSIGGAFGSSRLSQAIDSPPSVGGSFGGRQKSIPDVPDFSVPPPVIANQSFGESLVIEETKTAGGAFGSARAGFTSSITTIGGTFASRTDTSTSAFARSPASNVCPFGSAVFNTLSESPKPFGGGFRSKENQDPNSNHRGFPVGSAENVGGSFGRRFKTPEHLELNSDDGTTPDFDKVSAEFPKPEETNAPFMSVQSPPMRGGFQGGFRGGRGSGGQMDYGGAQGHSMGRGRGQPTQPFVPQQRGTPPPFSGHQQSQTVIPDPKYKYTKAQEESHEKAPIPADIALLNKYIQKEVKMMKDTVVDVQRQDPKSPLYSISSFRELRLKPEVLQALDSLNFQFPTRIQETALPLLLMEPPSNLIAQAQSGTGKTAAFVLTMLCRIDVNLKCPQCICLAPTLELAKQIGEVVEKMGRFMENLNIHYAIKGGNMAAMRGRKLTEQIVIGTPKVTLDYLQKYHCIDPKMIRCLVLDEADVMIYHQGFTDISTSIYNMVEEASDSVQSMLFSATYDAPVISFATKIIKNAIVVMLKREEQALPNIKQFYVQCACRDSKYAAIVNLYSGLAVASSVIFCHTKASVMWLFENMKARGHQVDVLHGDMTVVERADTIIRFKRGDFKVLITTNVFARGIDVAQVSVVINYDLPIKYTEMDTPLVIDGFTQPDCETYLHRIGRTGRFGKTGIAINFIDSENSMNMINVLENHFQMKIARMDPSNLVELEAIEMA